MKIFTKLFLFALIIIFSFGWKAVYAAQECIWFQGATSCNLNPAYPHEGILNNACIGPSPQPPSVCCCKVSQTQVSEAPKTQAEILSQCWSENECKQANGIWQETQFSRSYCKLDIENPPELKQCFAKNPDLPLQIGIPGTGVKYCSVYTLGEEPKVCTSDADCTSVGGICKPGVKGGFPGYLAAFYKFFVAALAVIAIVMVMWGGFKRIMAAGAPDKVKDANDTIVGAITGVVIALVSYSLLSLVNPKLVENTLPMIQKVKPSLLGITCPLYNNDPDLYSYGYTRLTGKCSNYDWVCKNDDDCGGGTCNGINLQSDGYPSYSTCGHDIYFSSTGLTCRGVGCLSGGCLQEEGSGRTYFYCSDFIADGTIKETNTELTAIDVFLICKNGNAFDCNSIGPSGATEDFMYVGGVDQYYYKYCVNSNKERVDPAKYCKDKGDFAGYALIVDVDGTDYAIDAQTCGAIPTKPITVGGETDPDDIDWSTLTQPSPLLITTIPKKCNLDINTIQFPNR